MARRLLSAGAMSFAVVIDRVRAEFLEMPGLELTLAQAVRLWTLGVDDCRHVIDALVDVGFLKWTARRTIVRTGLDLPAWTGWTDSRHSCQTATAAATIPCEIAPASWGHSASPVDRSDAEFASWAGQRRGTEQQRNRIATSRRSEFRR